MDYFLMIFFSQIKSLFMNQVLYFLFTLVKNLNVLTKKALLFQSKQTFNFRNNKFLQFVSQFCKNLSICM